MRRSDREITEHTGLLEVVKSCRVCRIATQDQQGLYIVPMNFGYAFQDEILRLYVHSATAGRKVDAFLQNPAVAFEMDCAHSLLEGKTACQYSYLYKSIIGNGNIRLLEDAKEKSDALSLIMLHQTGDVFAFTPQQVQSVHVYEITAQQYTGKQRL